MDRRLSYTVFGRFGRSIERLSSSCLQLIFIYKNSSLGLFLSQMNPVQALLLHLRFVLAFSHLHVGLRSGLHVCPPKFLMHCSSLSYVQHAPPSPFSLIWHLTDGIWQEIQIVKVLCMQFFPASSYFLLVPYIFLSAAFSNAVTLFSFLSLRG